jgi:hypothetical protein
VAYLGDFKVRKIWYGAYRLVHTKKDFVGLVVRRIDYDCLAGLYLECISDPLSGMCIY